MISKINQILSRTALIQAYFDRRRDFSFSFPRVISGIAKPPCTQIGPKHINRIEESEDFLVVYIKSVEDPLYWPKALPLYDLYKVVTECFYEDDWHFYEVPETTVTPGDTVIDCGAAEGIFSLRVLSRAGRIILFEPLPTFTPSLTKTFANHPNVTIIAKALGSTPGTASFSGTSLYGQISDDGDMTIEVTTIDEWSRSEHAQVDFIKGDLESFELEVLKGARETILAYKPKIALTVYHPGNNWHQMVDLVHKVVPEYAYRVKGLSFNDRVARPVMLHMWCQTR